MEKKKPVHNFVNGNIQCAEWHNLTAEGKTIVSFSFQKKYVDKNGEWAYGSSFSSSDLHRLRALIDYLEMSSVRFFDNQNKKDLENKKQENG